MDLEAMDPGQWIGSVIKQLSRKQKAGQGKRCRTGPDTSTSAAADRNGRRDRPRLVRMTRAVQQ
jgi:hypothetical protein